MSISNLTNNGQKAPEWYKFRFNSLILDGSLIADSISFSNGGATIDESHVYVNSSTGLDSNTGLTVGSPLLTLAKAVQVAAQDLPAARTVVFNLAGSNPLNMPEEDSGLPDGFKVADFNALSLKFSVIKFYGTATNIQEIGAGESTASADTSFEPYTRYTFDTATIEYDYSNGYFFNESKYPQYSGVYYANNIGVDYVRCLRKNDGVEADGFQLHTLAGPLLQCGNNNCALLSQIPVVFERCRINGPSTDGYMLKNLSSSPLSFHGCHLYINNTTGWLDAGEFLIYGCILTGATVNDQLTTDNAKVSIQNSNIYCKILSENEMTMNYCQGQNANIILRASSSNIDDCIFSCGYNFSKHLVECSASTLRCDNLRLAGYQSDAAYCSLYAEDSIISLNTVDVERYVESDAALADNIQIYNTNLSFEGSKTVVACNDKANGFAVFAETSNILVRGDSDGQRVFRGIGNPTFSLDNSQLVIGGMAAPSSDGFTCASDHVVYIHNSKLDLPEEAPYLNSPIIALKAQGISQIQSKASAGYTNSGAGDLYQLNSVSSDAFGAGYTSNSTGGFGQLFVGAI